MSHSTFLFEHNKFGRIGLIEIAGIPLSAYPWFPFDGPFPPAARYFFVIGSRGRGSPGQSY